MQSIMTEEHDLARSTSTCCKSLSVVYALWELYALAYAVY